MFCTKFNALGSHRNERIKDLVIKHNKILYAVPYQHFTNSIENYFSMLKSRLYKVSEEGEGPFNIYTFYTLSFLWH